MLLRMPTRPVPVETVSQYCSALCTRTLFQRWTHVSWKSAAQPFMPTALPADCSWHADGCSAKCCVFILPLALENKTTTTDFCQNDSHLKMEDTPAPERPNMYVTTNNFQHYYKESSYLPIIILVKTAIAFCISYFNYLFIIRNRQFQTVRKLEHLTP
jgi:hypothetical protein